MLAWRLHDGVCVPWGPDADGWWHSETLEVAFQPDHPFMRVRDRDGVELAPSGVLRRQTRTLEQHRAEDAQALARLEQRLEDEVRERTRLEEMVRRLTAQRDGPDVAPPHA